MKHTVILTLSLALLLTLSLQGITPAQEEQLCGVIVGETLLQPGQKAVFAFSNLGFPEQMWAMRGKTDKKTDYIKFDYVDHGITLDITNDDNVLKAILIRKSGLKMKGIPFDVGGSYDSVKKAWGEADKKEAGYANYFKKGVMIKVSDSGVIEIVAIYKPGKIDYDEMPKKKA